MAIRVTWIHTRRPFSCGTRPFPRATDPGLGTALIGRARFQSSGTHPVSSGLRSMATVIHQGRAAVSLIKSPIWAPSCPLSDLARQCPSEFLFLRGLASRAAHLSRNMMQLMVPLSLRPGIRWSTRGPLSAISGIRALLGARSRVLRSWTA